jgi:hypothetical protein
VNEQARRLLAAIAVFIASGAVQMPTFDRSVVSLDEGQLAAIGARMIAGDVLYRDIYTGIFPGIYWLAACLFQLFYVDVLVLRWAQVVVNCLTATFLFMLARSLAPGFLSVLVPVAYLALAMVSFPVFTMLTYSSVSLLAALGALLAARRYVASGSTAWGVAVGLLLAACVIFKQNYGALTLLAFGISFLFLRREGALTSKSLVSIMLPPIVAGLVVAAAAVNFLVASGGWENFLDATLLTILDSQMEAFDQPIPPLFGAHPTGDGKFLFFYGPGGMFGAMFHGHWWADPVALSRASRAGYGSAMLALVMLPFILWRFGFRGSAGERATARLIAPFAGLFFLGIFPSAIWSHLAAVFPPLLVILAASAYGAATLAATKAPFAYPAVVAVAMLSMAPVIATAAAVAADVRSFHSESHGLQGASVLLSARDSSLYGAADAFLRRCAGEGDSILVAPDMPLLYVMTGLRNPTPYDLVIPGDVRDDVLVQRVNGSNVRCVVYNPTMYAQFSSFDTLFPRLSAYLHEHFRETGSISAGGATWRFLERRAEVS